MTDLKSLIFPADLRVEIMWICYWLLFTANLEIFFAWKITKIEKQTKNASLSDSILRLLALLEIRRGPVETGEVSKPRKWQHFWVCYCPCKFITGSDKPVGNGPPLCCSFFSSVIASGADFVRSVLTQHVHRRKIPSNYLTLTRAVGYCQISIISLCLISKRSSMSLTVTLYPFLPAKSLLM